MFKSSRFNIKEDLKNNLKSGGKEGENPALMLSSIMVN